MSSRWQQIQNIDLYIINSRKCLHSNYTGTWGVNYKKYGTLIYKQSGILGQCSVFDFQRAFERVKPFWSVR